MIPVRELNRGFLAIARLEQSSVTRYAAQYGCAQVIDAQVIDAPRVYTQVVYAQNRAPNTARVSGQLLRMRRTTRATRVLECSMGAPEF